MQIDASSDSLTERSSFFPFQKPASRVRFDPSRDRVVAGGLDSQLKFFSVTDDHQVSVQYKIKVPSEIFALDFAADGSHFAMGLNDGSLVIRSKKQASDEQDQVKTEE